MKEKNVFVPDTSAIISGKVKELIENNTIKEGDEIIIPEFVISELENQANHGREIGFEGLKELKELRIIAKEKNININEAGRKPTMEEIQLAKSGRIDALIRDIAKEKGAILITCDMVQAMSAEALGVKVIYFEREVIESLEIEKYLDKETTSLHLKEGCLPLAKKGKPGNFKLVSVGDKELSREDLERIAKEIMERARIDENGMIEISRKGATVIQLGQYRIVITRPPFSERMEITLVRPIVKVTLNDYNLKEELIKRLEEKAEGILIAGPPGHGKTTLAQALAEFYAAKGKIVKTMEKPRDLQVSKLITQYTALEGDMGKTADILLLVRPDYTVYDELRTNHDFKIFCDMRLAGVGMIGVVHATQPIDAVHRFVNRVDLGIIPHIVDTILFVKGGKITKVYVLNMSVKVPTGMNAEDLARPVIDVIDFETGKVEYEIYTYGEQTVIMEMKEDAKNTVNKLAEERLTQILKKYIKNPIVKITGKNSAILKVDKDEVAKVIGKEGKRIAKLEEVTGMHLKVEPIVDTLKKEVKFDVVESGGTVQIKLPKKYVGKTIDIYAGEEYLISVTVGKKAVVKIKKNSDLGKKVLQALVLKNLKIYADI